MSVTIEVQSDLERSGTRVESTRDAAWDLWDAVKRDAANLIEGAGLDPGFVIPILTTVLFGMAIWFVVTNLFG